MARLPRADSRAGSRRRAPDYWELSALYGVKAKLRSGDVWVPGLRRYTDLTTPLTAAL